MKAPNSWCKKLNTISRLTFVLILLVLFDGIFAFFFKKPYDWLSILYYVIYSILIFGVLRLKISMFFTWVIYWLVPFVLWNISAFFIHQNFEGFRTLLISSLSTFSFSIMLIVLSEVFKLTDQEERRKNNDIKKKG